MKEEFMKLGEAMGFVRPVSPAELQAIAERQARSEILKLIKPCPDVLDGMSQTIGVAARTVEGTAENSTAQNQHSNYNQQGWTN
jgi:hypothetical protein